MYKRSSQINLALLHFDNNMIIPLDLDYPERFENKIFLAIAIKEEKKWVDSFPAVEREDPMWRDPRPIRFCKHKLITTSKAPILFAGQSKINKTLNPLKYVSSLTGVEFANSAAYYQQFDTAKSEQSMQGLSIFKNRCQFCHGTHQVGASMGWDFAGPIPAYEKRKPDSLLLHVKYEDAEQIQRGTLMPAQSDFQEKEAKALWHWLKTTAKEPVRSYNP
jgi:mono/diheme cytochrome c family protein